MKNEMLAKIGTWFYALVVGFFGVNHFLHAKDMGGMVPSAIPGGVIWVYITGACLIAAALAFILGKFSRLAGILLAVLLLVFVFVIHLPNAGSSDPNLQMMGMAGVLKDSGLAGAALVIAGYSKN